MVRRRAPVYGRSLAHSLLVLVPLCLGLYVLCRRIDRIEYAVASAIGALSHAIVDAFPLILTGEYEYAYFLLWPVLPIDIPSEKGSFTEHLLGIEPTPYFLFQIGLTIVAVMAWWRDGKPGLGPIRNITLETKRRLKIRR